MLVSDKFLALLYEDFGATDSDIVYHSLENTRCHSYEPQQNKEATQTRMKVSIRWRGQIGQEFEISHCQKCSEFSPDIPMRDSILSNKVNELCTVREEVEDLV